MTPAEARPILEPALAYTGGTHTYDDVCELIAEEKLQFWYHGGSAIVTEIISYPRKRLLNFFLAGGKLAELQAMLPAIIEWGRQHDCTEASLTGRAGWTRSFLSRQEGWIQDLVVMSKDIT